MYNNIYDEPRARIVDGLRGDEIVGRPQRHDLYCVVLHRNVLHYII